MQSVHIGLTALDARSASTGDLVSHAYAAPALSLPWCSVVRI